MGGRNEQANLRSSNNGNDRSVRAVNVKKVNDQVTTGGYDIEEPEPGNISVKAGKTQDINGPDPIP